MLCQFLEVSIFIIVIGIKNLRKIETSRNMASLQCICIRSAAAHKIYPTLNKYVQPGLWTKNYGKRMAAR